MNPLMKAAMPENIQIVKETLNFKLRPLNWKFSISTFCVITGDGSFYHNFLFFSFFFLMLDLRGRLIIRVDREIKERYLSELKEIFVSRSTELAREIEAT